MANLVRETNNILIEVDGGKNTFRLPLNTIRTDVLDESVRIISVLDRTVLVDFKPYDEYTIEGSPVTKLKDLTDWCVANFFVDASGGGGIPTLDPSNVIIGGESGNEYRTIRPKDLGWTTGNNIVFTTPSGTSISASIAYSADVEANTMALRNSNGCLTTNTPTEDKEAVDYGTVKGETNLTLGGDTTMANLDSAYPDAPMGYCIYNTQARLMWKKVPPTGEWIKIQLLPMS